MVQIPSWMILHSKSFPTSTHTPKSELKRRSYGPESWRRKTGCGQESMSRLGEYVATRKYGATRRVCCDQESMSRPEMLQKPIKGRKLSF